VINQLVPQSKTYRKQIARKYSSSRSESMSIRSEVTRCSAPEALPLGLESVVYAFHYVASPSCEIWLFCVIPCRRM